MKGLIFVFFLVFTFSLFAQSEEMERKKDTILELGEVIVTSRQMLGSKFRAKNRTGSAYYVSAQEIAKMNYTDINRMLKAVPGVNVYEEDGYGLRPNISLRGTKAERSEKITLMEDGVLIAPAPYAAPAAYYFPSVARMHAIEVLKGSSQVQYGPFTTGGAINLVSTPIPAKFEGKINSSYGTNDTHKTLISLGNLYQNFGFLVQYLRYSSNGFRSFEGFKKNDFISKIMFKSNDRERLNQSLELKFGYADEYSDETYVGLSWEDFIKNPFYRYAGSKMDNIKTKHQQWVATYNLHFSPKTQIVTNVYYNKFHRNWYKLNDVKVGISSVQKRSINQILEDVQTNHLYFDILTGKQDYVGEALIVRANNRSYVASGIQTKWEQKIFFNNFSLNTELAFRYHYDHEDRFQWDDSYAMQNEQMTLFLAGIPGEQSNQITWAKALASYFLSKLNYHNWTVTAGLRFEDIHLHRNNFTKVDVRRTGRVRQETTNKVQAFIPSVGINYKIRNNLTTFAGLHKGFSPPSAGLNQKYESSVNVEWGLRGQLSRGFSYEIIGFHNKYSNMLGSDLAASGGTGTLEQFDVGKAQVSGAEVLLVQNNFLPESFPVGLSCELSYTYTTTQILNSFEENSWGRVLSGDEIPYINKHALNASTGLSYKAAELHLGIRHNANMRSAPGQGPIAQRYKIPAHTILDASVKVKINKYLTVNLNAINLTNKKYLVSRHPSGLRPGHPFGLFGGGIVSF